MEKPRIVEINVEADAEWVIGQLKSQGFDADEDGADSDLADKVCGLSKSLFFQYDTQTNRVVGLVSRALGPPRKLL